MAVTAVGGGGGWRESDGGRSQEDAGVLINLLLFRRERVLAGSCGCCVGTDPSGEAGDGARVRARKGR